MTAMPSLQGSVAYIFSSCDLDILSSKSVRFKDMIDRFRVYDQPRSPEPKEEVWLAGERVDTRGAHSFKHAPPPTTHIYVDIFRLSSLWTSLPPHR